MITGKVNRRMIFYVIFLGLFLAQAPVAYGAKPQVPPPLQQWQHWVLHGKEDRLCPSVYNNGDDRRCRWPSRLLLELAQTGGNFGLDYELFAPAWVFLPGGGEHWPEQITVNQVATAVVERNKRPAMYLEPGRYTVKGIFQWSLLPPIVMVPPDIGLIDLKVDGHRVIHPDLDQKGRLWLQRSLTQSVKPIKLEMRFFRLVEDTIPVQITTHLQVVISGPVRELKLARLFLEGAIPMGIESPLPAQIDADQNVLVQARPGKWHLQLKSRLPGPVERLQLPKDRQNDEIWSFRPYNHLSMVEVSGVPAVEPARTDMPPAWRKYAAYIIKPGSEMIFKTLRRGDPDPAPDRLNLERIMWLDFDGQGLTFFDRVTGTMSRQWYLAMDPKVALGRVAVDGRDQLITVQGPHGEPGVELRRGALTLEADSRIPEHVNTIPAIGWQHDFQSVSGILNLPPGWRLIDAQGVDAMPGTWLQRWSLLDLFLILIISVGVAKLRRWGWGLLALAAMVLIYHETGAPRLIWISLLLVLALLPKLPRGWFKRLAYIWGILSVIVLVAQSIPFMVHQVRIGVYPQLERSSPMPYWRQEQAQDASAPGMARQASLVKPKKVLLAEKDEEQTVAEALLPASRSPQKAVSMHDPDALVQTGPGLPTWKWKTFPMQWNGPVKKGQQIRLWLLSPLHNLILAFLRVGLLTALILCLVDLKYWSQLIGRKTSTVAAVFWMSVLSGLIAGTPNPLHAMDFPPPAMLQELEQRLLEKPPCLPNCADIQRLDLTATPDSLQVLLQVHAVEPTAIPLPVASNSWVPTTLFLNDQVLSKLQKDTAGIWWTLVSPGVHTVVLSGPTDTLDRLQLPMHLRPHIGASSLKGWELKGIHSDGKVDATIQLDRLQPADKNKGQRRLGVLSPFFSIKRTLKLGLTWSIDTHITRRTPVGTPVTISLPLLKNESITTANIEVAGGRALINLAPGARQFTFASAIPISTRIVLAAPKAVPWTETWILDASPIWHCDLSGITVTHHQDRSGFWRPEWRPWPAERVEIAISRPEGIPGQVITVDQAKLTVTPGTRISNSRFELVLRSSQGGQHELSLPPRAELQSVQIDGKSLPIRQKGQQVAVPISPGRQSIILVWHAPTVGHNFIQGPPVLIGHEAVNAQVTFRMPPKRWVLLTGGPRLGPAVLFWSYLAVVVLAALVLSRIQFVPIKSYQWFLLGLGLTQIHPLGAILVVGWLLALEARARLTDAKDKAYFNLIQIGLVLLTVLALAALYLAVEKGLLGIPDMQIDGNHSSRTELHWTQDRVASTMPRPWVVHLPQWSYHLLMLFWSLWMAFTLIKWLRWAWTCFSREMVWRKVTVWRRPKKVKGMD